MKKKINKAAWDKLSDEMKALYSLVGNSYILQVEDEDDDEPQPGDGSAAKTALERKHRKKAEKERDEAIAALEALQGEKETATNSVATMKIAHDKKVAKIEKERDDAILMHKNYVGGSLKDKTAGDIAAKLTKSPKIMLPHLMARLDVNYDGDEPSVVVLDAKGKPSTATLDDLTKEFRDNKDFAGIVQTSQASGGGASRPGVTAPVGSAPASGSQQQNAIPLSRMKANDLAATMREKREARAAAQGAA